MVAKILQNILSALILTLLSKLILVKINVCMFIFINYHTIKKLHKLIFLAKNNSFSSMFFNYFTVLNFWVELTIFRSHQFLKVGREIDHPLLKVSQK